MNFRSEEMRRNPFPAYDQIRRRSPVLQDPSSDAWMVFHYDGVKRVLSDHAAFSSSMSAANRPSPQWFIFFDPPRHTRLRALVTKAFTPAVITGLEPRIRELSSGLLDQIIEHGEMDLAADFSIPLPMMVIAQLLGLPSQDWLQFRRWGDAILALSYTISGGDEGVQASNAYFTVTAEMQGYLGRLIDQRQAEPKQDLLTRLVQAEVDGARLTAQEMLGFFQLLLVAGTETTTNLLNNAILCLLEHPGEFARLQAAPDLLYSAIEEVLRYRSPIQWMFRATTREIELAGQTIPAGKLVLPMIGSANRDPEQFAEPERFDIARDPNPHIAFGFGIHFCLGAQLSRLEARIALPQLLGRLTNLELADSQPWEPRRALHVHGPSRLPLRFQPGRLAAHAT